MEKTISISDLEKYMDEKVSKLKDDKSFGGFEGKLENGKITYFKYWVGKKI